MNSLTKRLQVLVFALMALSFSSVVFAQAAPVAQVPIDERVVSEIEQIRRRMGDGVAERLSGLISEEVAGQDFQDELRRQHVGSLQPIRQAGGGQGRPQPFRTGEVLRIQEAPSRSRVVGSHFESQLGAEPSRGVHYLREAARRMEELAAGFEEVSLFDEADQLRAQAAKFWLKARSHHETSKQLIQAQNRGPIQNPPRSEQRFGTTEAIPPVSDELGVGK